MASGNECGINLLGVGLYSVSQAARLASLSGGVPFSAQVVGRWLWGGPSQSGGDARRSIPLWDPHLPLLNGSRYLSFQDLIEVLFVAAFRRQGISLQSIRRILAQASALAEHPYPLSHVSFKTIGKTIVAQAIAEDTKELAFELESGQYLLDFMLDKLTSCLDYSEIQTAARWWPLGKERAVVLDPGRRFGRPIIEEAAVPTAALAGAFRAEGSIKVVAEWYGVSEGSVEDALEYEHRLQAA